MTPTLDTLATMIHQHSMEHGISILRMSCCNDDQSWHCSYYEGEKKERRLKWCDAATHSAFKPLMEKMNGFLAAFPSRVTEIAHPRDQVYLVWGISRTDGEDRMWYQPVDLAEN